MNNRIIKFRVWNKNLNRWAGAESYGMLNQDPKDWTKWIAQDLNNHIYLIVQQFTNLLDINNKEIFEGDLVKITYTDSTPEGRIDKEDKIRLVKWDSVELKWGLEYPDFNTFCERLSDFKGNIEVVGNIFETPELLNN